MLRVWIFLDVPQIYNHRYNYFENIAVKQVIFLEEKIMKSANICLLTQKRQMKKDPQSYSNITIKTEL